MVSDDMRRDIIDKIASYIGEPTAASVQVRARSMYDNLLSPHFTHLEQDLSEYARLTEKLGQILDGVAAALKGDPVPGRMHDWSDLPKLAKRIKDEHDLAWPHYTT